MTDALQEDEKQKYEQIWGIDDYRVVSPAVRDLASFFEFCRPIKDDSVIDFGCGTGQADKLLFEEGYNVHMLDITEKALNPLVKQLIDGLKDFQPEPGEPFMSFEECCLWDLPETLIYKTAINKTALTQFDWVVSFDVFEHLPEERIDTVLENANLLMKKGGFFQICTVGDGFGKRIGKELHLTIREHQWWLDKLAKHFKVVKSSWKPQHLLVSVAKKG